MKEIVKEIKISVVCPTYNSEKFIIKTLDSILLQQETPYEVIFVDDGSTDQTVNILNKYKIEFIKKNINYFIIQNNHNGPGNARNAGIKKSSGNWISFLDSDDTWSSLKLLKVKETILSNDKINFILHWEKLVDNGYSKILKHGEKYNENENLSYQLFKKNFISTSATTCAKYLLEENNFDEKLKVSQDYELWLRLSPEIYIFIIKEVLGNYIIRKGSITSKPYRIRLFFLIKILFRHRNKSNIFYLIFRILRAFVTKQWIRK